MMKSNKILLGGQAVIEGVMIKSPNFMTVSVRNENGNIISMNKRLMKPKYKFLAWPFFRGVYNLFQMLVIGTKSLVWSANQNSKEEEELSKSALILTIGLSIFFALLIFLALPYFLTNLIGIKENINPILFNLVDGIIKITLFLLYIIMISFMKDVKRLFQYHGAEHMTVYCYESGKNLTYKNVSKFPTMHPRCGTSFIMLVFIVSMLLFSILPILVLSINPSFITISFLYQKLILFVLRIMLVPVIAGTAYELLKLGAKYHNNILFKVMVRPGIWLQLLTTKDPDKKQIEVAIHSLKYSLQLERI